jgi:hypothetical protein
MAISAREGSVFSREKPMKMKQLLVANSLVAIFVYNFFRGETAAGRIIATSLGAGVLTATCILGVTRVILGKDIRLRFHSSLRWIPVPVSISVLIPVISILLITFATVAFGTIANVVPNYSGAALAGTVAGALAGIIASWPRADTTGTVRIANLSRTLDPKAGAVGAGLALAFALGPTGEYRVHFDGIVIAILTGLVTAAVSSRLVKTLGGSIAGALKSAVCATFTSALGFLFGAYLAVLSGTFLLLTSGLSQVMASTTMVGALSRALVVLEYGALLLIATLGVMVVSSVTTVLANARAGTLVLTIGLVYAGLGYVLGVLSFPQLDPANFEGALAGGLAGILAGACVGLEGHAFKGVTAGLVGGSVAQILGSAVAPLTILVLRRIYGTVFGGLGPVAGQLDPGLLGAVFGGVLGGFFLTSFNARMGELWGEICVGIVSGMLAFMLILTTEVTLMSALKIALRTITSPIPGP